MNIVIIDTACANIFSVASVIKHLGYQFKISKDLKILLKADKLFLPGVGTAKAAMEYLHKLKIVNFIKNCTKPILGICLGMQLFGNTSAENNNIKTLEILNITTEPIKKCGFPLPHIGWNQVQICKDNILFKNILNNNYFYFMHKYVMKNFCSTVAQSYYGEYFSAAIEYKNFFGVQFHPEKSGYIGHQIIKNFLEI